ncbi:sigma-70 family RNA polymerase sigma factor [Ornithinibacillus scapharcae]|uniref:sigma-70 family RNA polymerase sigma factor n=1 Tax=Ornithinibacillus scapharcae TaxID=1147159 RepID=UPI000225B073|nr:sigma-70 family RNA polymerase sigma factor [Ornithinibacillus scapharcae]
MQGEGAIHFDSNDPKALEHIVERYRVIAERLCFQYGVKPKEISTVVQDVFIKVDQKIKRQEPGSLSSWFYHVVIRTLREYESKQKKAKKIGRALDEPISYGYYLENHGHISIQDALAKLDNKYKLPLILNHYHDIKLEDISTILKMNQETITKRIQQGENLLSDSYKEAATKNPYLVDKFEAVFRDLNYRYQLLPEFTSTVDIMTRVEQSRKRIIGKNILLLLERS